MNMMWKKFRRVQFELSHRCPLNKEHPKCPINLMKDKYEGFLPMEEIFKVCRILKEAGNSTPTGAELCFHLYNEPSVDCRLAYIVSKIREMGMKNPINLASFTYGIDEVVLNELIDIGVDNFLFALPSEDLLKKWQDIRDRVKKPICFRTYIRCPDNRVGIYQGEHLMPDLKDTQWKDNTPFRCSAPLNMLIIGCEGDVRLCEYDWDKTVVFGNIYKDSWDTILQRKREMDNDLQKHGRQGRDVCSKCTFMFR